MIFGQADLDDGARPDGRDPTPPSGAAKPPCEAAFRQGIRLASARPALLALSLGLYALFYTLPLLPGLLQREIFDALSGHRQVGLDVWSLVALWMGAQLSPLIASYFANWSFVAFTTFTRQMMRRNMMGWMMFARGPRSSPGTPGEALSRFRDDVSETIAFIEGWSDTFGQMISALLALAIMWRIDPGVTAAVAAPMLVVVLITQRITAGIHRYSRVAREAEAGVTSFVGEIFAAVQAIRVGASEPRILARLAELNGARRRAAVRHRVYVTLLDTFGSGTSSLAFGLVLVLAAGAMKSGRFTVGDFTLFAAYVGTVTSAPRWLGRLMARKRTADVALMRIERMLGDAPLDAITGTAPAKPGQYSGAGRLDVLEVRGLACRHAVGGGGVRNIDFSLRRGQVLVITGRVGAGKTTLLRGLLGLMPLDAGAVLWNGQPVDDPATFMVPPRCAYTPQAPRLFSGTLRENIQMGAQADDAGLMRAARLGVLDGDIAGFPGGLDTLVGTRGVTLSGGQVQRTGAARMFAARSDLLVLDDVSSALDVSTERMLWDRLFAEGDHTAIVVSHRLEAFRRADEILVLDGGVVVARGALRELLARSSVFRNLWHQTLRAPHGA